MDAATWRTIAHLAIFCGALLVAGGALASYFTGHAVDATREREARARRDELKGRLDAVDAEQRNLVARLAPFENLARQRFPDLPAEQSLAQLLNELRITRELPPPDVPKSPASRAEDAVVRNLRELVQRGEMPTLTVNVANVGAENVRHVFAALVHMLELAGAPHRVGKVVGTPVALGAPDEPYTFVTRSGDEGAAARLAEAFRPFITSDPAVAVDDSLPAGTVVLAFRPLTIDLHGDGSVGLR
jgi:hypothetical protein